MLERTNSRIFTFLLGLSALTVAAAAAIFSVTGLSMLYSGKMVYVAIAMGALEFAKIITASYLYRYWKLVGWGLKTYLSLALLVLMLITSGGIYGYLTNSYQGSVVGLDKINSQTEVLEQQKQNLTSERERLVTDIATLRQERQSTIQNRNNEIAANNVAADSNSVKFRVWRNSQVFKRYDEELSNIDNNINRYTINLDSTTTKLSKINDNISNKKLEMIDTGIDIGPLVYMARIFNTTMDNVMKWFTLVIVFVFDPLAVALVIALNTVLVKSKEEEEFSSKQSISTSGEKSVISEGEEEEEDELDLGEPDDLSFMKEKNEEEEIEDEKIEENIIDEDEDDPNLFNFPITFPKTKSIEMVEDEVDNMNENDYKDFTENIVDLDEDFTETLNETTKKIGKDEPTKPRIEEEPKEEVEKENKEVKENPTKDIVVPGSKLELMDFSLVKDGGEPLVNNETGERVILEPAKSGDIPKEKIKSAVDKVKHQNEFFDEMREEKDGEVKEIKDYDKTKTFLVTDDDIRDYFDDAVKKVRKRDQGKITKVLFQPGGSVSIDHLEDDPDIDYSIQE